MKTLRRRRKLGSNPDKPVGHDGKMPQKGTKAQKTIPFLLCFFVAMYSIRSSYVDSGR
jgi:hypothetical protein